EKRKNRLAIPALGGKDLQQLTLMIDGPRGKGRIDKIFCKFFSNTSQIKLRIQTNTKQIGNETSLIKSDYGYYLR
ncbi:MAG: hypothetical protein RID07_09405, partial [Lacipirellulaceae bacterium]